MTDDVILHEAPLKPGEEWANALSHGVATVIAILAGAALIRSTVAGDPDMTIPCAAYAVTVVGTFLCSTLSHAIHRQPWLNTFRSWDQAMIYLMITGTYTPIVAAFADPSIKPWLMAAIWIAALAGFVTKVALRHRINAIGTASYLMLGWLPAIPLIGQVPGGLALGMFLGGVLYTLGVGFLLFDHKAKYLHVVWHVFVMAAAMVHYAAILRYCVGSGGY